MSSLSCTFVTTGKDLWTCPYWQQTGDTRHSPPAPGRLLLEKKGHRALLTAELTRKIWQDRLIEEARRLPAARPAGNTGRWYALYGSHIMERGFDWKRAKRCPACPGGPPCPLQVAKPCCYTYLLLPGSGCPLDGQTLATYKDSTRS